MIYLLHEVFDQFGRLLDIKVCKRAHIRGQAFICFKELACAMKAKEELNGFLFLGKPLIIEYAKRKSHALMRLDGSYSAMMAKIRQDFLKKEAEEQAERAKGEYEAAVKEVQLVKLEGKEAEERQRKLMKLGVSGKSERPTSVLLLQGAPRDIVQQDMEDLFGQFDGFTQVDEVPGLEGTYIAEFDSLEQAIVVKQAMEGFKFPDQADAVGLSCDFARRPEHWVRTQQRVEARERQAQQAKRGEEGHVLL